MSYSYDRHLTTRYIEGGSGEVIGSMHITWHSRFIDIGRGDTSIIPPDDMP